MSPLFFATGGKGEECEKENKRNSTQATDRLFRDLTEVIVADQRLEREREVRLPTRSWRQKSCNWQAKSEMVFGPNASHTQKQEEHVREISSLSNRRDEQWRRLCLIANVITDLTRYFHSPANEEEERNDAIVVLSALSLSRTKRKDVCERDVMLSLRMLPMRAMSVGSSV